MCVCVCVCVCVCARVCMWVPVCVLIRARCLPLWLLVQSVSDIIRMQLVEVASPEAVGVNTHTQLHTNTRFCETERKTHTAKLGLSRYHVFMALHLWTKLLTITISQYLYNNTNMTVSVRFSCNFVYCVLCLFLIRQHFLCCTND